jgi:hypothetical protein
MYRITATFTDSNGNNVSANTPEVLGDAARMTFGTRQQAEDAARAMQDSVADYGLPESVVYAVESAS